jgi:hypothetical protein
MKKTATLIVLGSLSVLAACGRDHETELSPSLSTLQALRQECSVRLTNLGEEEFPGIKVNPSIRFAVPEGHYRYTFAGHDEFSGQQRCQVVIDASNSPQCGAQIFGMRSTGRYKSSDGTVEDAIPGGTIDASPISIKHSGLFTVPHALRSGLTIKQSAPRGLLSRAEEFKLFGESLRSLSAYEHTSPVFPLGQQKFRCVGLTLTSVTSFNVDPYEGIY